MPRCIMIPSMFALAVGFGVSELQAETFVPFLVKDINPGPDASGPGCLFPFVCPNMNGRIFFIATDVTNGVELWKSDGTEAGTSLVKDINPGALGSFGESLTNVNGTLFFVANDGTNGIELWRSDGTEGGTVMVKDINPLGDSFPSNLTNLKGTLLFAAEDDTNGKELWKSDGTEAGTVMVADINPTGGSGPAGLIVFNGTLFFSAWDGIHGSELWRSDGTASGTVMVKDITPGASSSFPRFFTNVAGTILFSAGLGNKELWKSDGTEAGTVMVKDINPGGFGSSPKSLTNVNGTLFFTANDGTHGIELWMSDGTEAGTLMVKDINPLGHSFPTGLTNVEGTLFLAANDGTHGIELWVSDGTEAGTVMVADINPTGDSFPLETGNLRNFSGTLFFAADNGINGKELWRSDGTGPGTFMVTDLNPTGNSSPFLLTSSNATLFFRADDGTTGLELWALRVPTLDVCGSVARFQGLGDVPGGSFSSGAVAVSADGSTVLGKGTPEGAGNVVAPEAFVWTAESGLVGLGSLPGGSDRSFGTAISSDGSVIVGKSNSTFTDPVFGSEAFRWTQAGGMVGLGDLPGGTFGSAASFVSADGSVVVGVGRNNSTVTPGGAREVFRWTPATGMVGLGSLPGGFPASASTANAMSSDGSVIVGRATSAGATSAQAFRWTQAGGMVGLGDLPGASFLSEATAVSADGSVVAGQSHSEAAGNTLEVFRWTAETGMVGLGTLPGGSNSRASAMSADGSVIVGTSLLDSAPNSHEAFRWTAQTGMVGLGDFPGGEVHSTALAVSADGAIVIGIGCTETDTFEFLCVSPEAFIWDAENGMRRVQDVLVNEFGLDLTGWTDLFVSDMTPDGRTLVGSGVNPNGDGEGWIATLGTRADQCCLAEAPVQVDTVVATNRYLAFTAGVAGRPQAIRVTFANLASPHDVLNGVTMWVGEPSEVSENSGVVEPIPDFDTFTAATLTCQPFFTDWSAVGTVHVFHENIIPGGDYMVQVVDEVCDVTIKGSFSAPLELTMARWGDTVENCAMIPCPPPEGTVTILDVLAGVDKFVNAADAIIKARADVQPATPDRIVNVLDVLRGVDALIGLPYPFPPGPAPCP